MARKPENGNRKRHILIADGNEKVTSILQMAFEGSGEHTRVHVNFLHAGAKWLVLAYANLQSP